MEPPVRNMEHDSKTTLLANITQTQIIAYQQPSFFQRQTYSVTNNLYIINAQRGCFFLKTIFKLFNPHFTSFFKPGWKKANTTNMAFSLQL